jgi:hypothetical protein
MANAVASTAKVFKVFTVNSRLGWNPDLANQCNYAKTAIALGVSCPIAGDFAKSPGKNHRTATPI